MIFFFVIQTAAVLTIAAASSIAPWWAVSVEHILEAWGSAFIVALVPTGATLIRGVISHREHIKNLTAIQVATADRDQIKLAIAENTALTVEAAVASKEAAQVANNVNEKIAATNDRIGEIIDVGKNAAPQPQARK